jgi:hypothetical protein
VLLASLQLAASAQAVGVRCVVAGGGGTSTAGGTRVFHTIGQPAVGRATSPDAGARSGFEETLPGLVVVATQETPPAAPRYVLAQSVPNPTTAYTTIRFSLARPGETSLRIYDASGRLVEVLVDAFLPAGEHDAAFHAGQLASGVYFYELKSGSFSQTHSLTFIR